MTSLGSSGANVEESMNKNAMPGGNGVNLNEAGAHSDTNKQKPF